MKTLILITLNFALLLTASLAGEETMSEKHTLIDFTAGGPGWQPVNDGVMGGLSRSGFSDSGDGTGIFAGQLSLENNGGFASVRTILQQPDLSAYSGVEMQVRGDGRTYQLRFRNDRRFDGAAYRALFATRPGEWITVRLPFADFVPTFRGRVLSGYGPLDTSDLQQLTLMVADKKAGPFRLELKSIVAYQDQ
jgi:NADH dehydrogenase [ubiquinone] 1 alpha subcomplex assembly factor 1